MPTISVCMIVKNEEKILARCLDSLEGIMDELIIVDTGSTDATKEIARRYTDQVYDFKWHDDFSAARNFSFSKATMDYIYAADADEVLDEENRIKFKQVKAVLLPEIEIVQMIYVNPKDYNTVQNFQKEYRPKLFKRTRSFSWIGSVHETVNLNPVVYDSEIEILHLPENCHAQRDFETFLKAFQKGERLSKKLHSMYAKELFISGTDADFLKAKPVFLDSLMDERRTPDEQKEASCVLVRIFRLEKNPNAFFKLALKDMLSTPCAEMCCEIGEYYYEAKDFGEAALWFYHAAYETESIINIRCSGNIPLFRLADCYEALGGYEDLVIDYKKQAAEWQLPEII